MPIFIATIFLSAFLLFQVQPVVARYILPWYGGSPAVWTTCMLFFQVGLLAGYTYAHALATWFRNRKRLQAAIHLTLITLSFLLLPVTPSESLKPTSAGDPTWGIILLLLRTVGLPFLAIAASGPLLQHWFSSAFPGKSPYRLYAVSNAGSLLALVSYPFLVEPLLGLRFQTHLWSVTYVGYGVLAALCAWQVLKRSPAKEDTPLSDTGADLPPNTPTRILWGAFATLGSLLLLACTNKMCQDIAVVPFLWVLPLALYLLTFIIAFDHARWYRRTVWIPLALIAILALAKLLSHDYFGDEYSIIVQIAIYMGALFVCCMVCHGEMVRLKPSPRYLTSFYLVIALGGALGGLFVSQIAPRIFVGYWELHAGLALFTVLIAGIIIRDYLRSSPSRPLLTFCGLGIPAALMILITGAMLWTHISKESEGAIKSLRGFYGVLHVYESDPETPDHLRKLYHGRINHGTQYLASESQRRTSTTYYVKESGAGLAVTLHPKRTATPRESVKIGVVGLGAGAIAPYALDNDSLRYYEINPQVESLAREYFTYLEDCRGDAKVILGDARISLEAELARGETHEFDVLCLDAFSGDSIPIHLLTREAFEVYLEHLAPSGILAVHITNLHIDLTDPLRTIADSFGLCQVWVEHDGDGGDASYSSYILMSRDPASLASIVEKGFTMAWKQDKPSPILWTDDYSNLLQVIDFD